MSQPRPSSRPAPCRTCFLLLALLLLSTPSLSASPTASSNSIPTTSPPPPPSFVRFLASPPVFTASGPSLARRALLSSTFPTPAARAPSTEARLTFLVQLSRSSSARERASLAASFGLDFVHPLETASMAYIVRASFEGVKRALVEAEGRDGAGLAVWYAGLVEDGKVGTWMPGEERWENKVGLDGGVRALTSRVALKEMQKASENSSAAQTQTVILKVLLVEAFLDQKVAQLAAEWTTSAGGNGTVKCTADSQRVVECEVFQAVNVPEVAVFLGTQPETLWVEQRPKSTLLVNRITPWGQARVSAAVAAPTTPLWAQNITGRNIVIGIADSGLDLRSCFFANSDTNYSTPQSCSLAGNRKVACYFTGSDTVDQSGHGTHVSGIAAGLHLHTSISGNPNYRNLMTDGEYMNGVAPAAKIAFTDIGAANGGIYPPSDLSNLFFPPYSQGAARIHSNSWGCSQGDPRYCNRYDIDAHNIDDFTWKHPDMLVIFAAGNDGGYPYTTAGQYSDGLYTVGSPGTAKNALTIAASQNVHAGKACRAYACNNENIMAASSRGPTFDGRTKPDVAFVGENVYSAIANVARTWQCASETESDGIMLLSGTSMAAPGIAGLAALVRDYYITHNPHTGSKNVSAGPLGDGYGPSAALVKATILAGARRMQGVFSIASGSGWSSTIKISTYARRDAIEGYGLASLQGALKFEGDGTTKYIVDRQQIDTGETDVFEIDAVVGGRLQIFMVYTDYPALPNNPFDTVPRLINNIDIALSCASNPCSISSTVTSASTINNVESLDVSFTSSGRLKLSVLATSVAMGPQPYSIIMSGEQFNVVSAPQNDYQPKWTLPNIHISGEVDQYYTQPVNESGGMNTWAIVGIVVGSVAGAAVIASLTFLFIQKRRNRANSEAEDYYGNAPVSAMEI